MTSIIKIQYKNAVKRLCGFITQRERYTNGLLHYKLEKIAQKINANKRVNNRKSENKLDKNSKEQKSTRKQLRKERKLKNNKKQKVN